VAWWYILFKINYTTTRLVNNWNTTCSCRIIDTTFVCTSLNFEKTVVTPIYVPRVDHQPIRHSVFYCNNRLNTTPFNIFCQINNHGILYVWSSLKSRVLGLRRSIYVFEHLWFRSIGLSAHVLLPFSSYGHGGTLYGWQL